MLWQKTALLPPSYAKPLYPIMLNYMRRSCLRKTYINYMRLSIAGSLQSLLQSECCSLLVIVKVP